ncbi:hypothetical protein GOODEAATRI_031328 [Goodea atripinnis]|uniref:Uncharacterized protein n=1 Tax=Goodea atripinnis TaxID=208336 RepID=A0ABV0P206_9TELE
MLIRKGNLKRPVNQQLCFSTVGGSWSTWRDPTHACEEHENTMQKDQRLGFKPRTFLQRGNSATNCTTIKPYIKLKKKHHLKIVGVVQPQTCAGVKHITLCKFDVINPRLYLRSHWTLEDSSLHWVISRCFCRTEEPQTTESNRSPEISLQFFIIH